MASPEVPDMFGRIALMAHTVWSWIFVASVASVATAATHAQNPGLASANGVYNGSKTPSSLPWNTYNYCNAPHVVPAHYTLPTAKGAKLVYVNTVIRHHKVRAIWFRRS